MQLTDLSLLHTSEPGPFGIQQDSVKVDCWGQGAYLWSLSGEPGKKTLSCFLGVRHNLLSHVLENSVLVFILKGGKSVFRI